MYTTPLGHKEELRQETASSLSDSKAVFVNEHDLGSGCNSGIHPLLQEGDLPEKCTL